MKRALTLMTVMLGGGVASADPTPTAPAVTPRVLATGAPACGNVVSKYGMQPEDPFCPVVRNLRELEALGRKLDAELQKLAVETASLTLFARPRPGL